MRQERVSLSCGAKIEDDNVFCTECGTKIDSAIKSMGSSYSRYG